jgi:hypothetical protein
MNAEHMHQLYGGDMYDYLTPTKNLNKENVSSFDPTGEITNIYTSQIQNKGAIDTKGLISSNINLTSLIDQQPPDPLQQMLNQTLSRIAQEHNLEGAPGVNKHNIPDLIVPRDQTADDINLAQNNILAALEELKSMGVV